jgi:hypothetical protein
MEVAMARAIAEKTNAVQLNNHTASTVSAIDHLPFGKKTTVRLLSHLPTISSAVKNLSTCTRCGGLMVNEFYMDLLDSVGESKFPPKRCVQCGEVVDFVILLNRQQGQQPMTTQLAREMSSNNPMTQDQ